MSATNITPFISAMTNTSSQVSQKISITTYLIPIIIVLVIIITGVAVWNWYRWSSSPWWADRATATTHFWNLFGTSENTALDPSKLSALSDISSSLGRDDLVEEARKRIEETWCFVGEDSSGRWCVQVPSTHACDPPRTFSSRSDCTYTEASPMPLGIQSRGDSIPLSEIPIMSYAVGKDVNKDQMHKQLTQTRIS